MEPRPASDWHREWRAAELVERAADLRSLAPAIVLALVAAGASTLIGTSVGDDLRPTVAQIAAATAAAGVSLAVVPAALRRAATPIDLVVLVAALLSAGAAAIHFAVIRGHFDEWWGFGVFFIVSGLAQLAWSVLVATRPSRLLFLLGVAGNVAIVALWIVTRTYGPLLGPTPDEAEPVGVADTIASVFETLIVAAAIGLAWRGVPRRRVLRPTALAVGLIALAATAVALLSAMGAASGVIPATE